jgi:hypothetical protein
MISLPISIYNYFQIAVYFVIESVTLLEFILQKNYYISKVFITLETVIYVVEFAQLLAQGLLKFLRFLD